MSNCYGKQLNEIDECSECRIKCSCLREMNKLDTAQRKAHRIALIKRHTQLKNIRIKRNKEANNTKK